jgi:hypothetical protein
MAERLPASAANSADELVGFRFLEGHGGIPPPGSPLERGPNSGERILRRTG